jgi:hypothetical protein
MICLTGIQDKPKYHIFYIFLHCFLLFNLLIQWEIFTDITDLDLLLLTQATWPKRSLTLRFSPLPETMLINPPLRKYGQWVWELRDPSGKQLKDFISSSQTNP